MDNVTASSFFKLLSNPKKCPPSMLSTMLFSSVDYGVFSMFLASQTWQQLNRFTRRKNSRSVGCGNTLNPLVLVLFYPDFKMPHAHATLLKRATATVITSWLGLENSHLRLQGLLTRATCLNFLEGVIPQPSIKLSWSWSWAFLERALWLPFLK